MQPLRIAPLVIFSLLFGCRSPELKPRLILQSEPVGGAFWLAAPYLAVVQIKHADAQGAPDPIYHGGPKTLQLMKYEADVENLMKGDLPRKITFFFFMKLDQKPRYDLEPGRRYIVALRNEGGVLRSSADATQLSIAVTSGLHAQRDLPLDQGLETTIAYILLTPGEDFDLKQFLVLWPPYSFGSPQYVYGRLKRLESERDPQLAYTACAAMASMFWFRPKCLYQAAHSQELDIRHRAETFIAEDDARLLERLSVNPFFLSPVSWTDYSVQMLEIYTDDERPEVRKRACEVLRVVAPLQIGKKCT